MNAIVKSNLDNTYRVGKIKPAESIDMIINSSWENIAPAWPLKNLIAVNPLSGLEDLPFEQALIQAELNFQQSEIPHDMQIINRESIKWLQAFFDDGQARIQMPNRELGLFRAILSLIKYDNKLPVKARGKIKFIEKHSNTQDLIVILLSSLDIERRTYKNFITLLLTTLPGWASYVRYRTDWSDIEDINKSFHVTKTDYIAFRLMLTYLLWPEAKRLLDWQKSLESSKAVKIYNKIKQDELLFQQHLLTQLQPSVSHNNIDAFNKAQFVFCIDVRSEPFRRAIEEQGEFETFGYAGFFGVPVNIKNDVAEKYYASCPVLLKPTCNVTVMPADKLSLMSKLNDYTAFFKKIYQSLKYNFTTPFVLVEIVGVISGAWMALRSCIPVNLLLYLKSTKQYALSKQMICCAEEVSLQQKADWAFNMLRLIGLVDNFASFVFLCGHGSSTQNNAYSTSLDCGACGGRSGAANAIIMADILNNRKIRHKLEMKGIKIPQKTFFIAAEHNTTSDELSFCAAIPDDIKIELESLLPAIRAAQSTNANNRLKKMGISISKEHSLKKAYLYSKDWAQVRPEFGLAKNAALIVGPRKITEDINLDGRAFLHSYDWKLDIDGSLLNSILTAPMIVAQWINAQYLFSTIDNVSYGGGSKVTKNITGKIGIMQGNASDLMCGLSLQSVYINDREAYHVPLRLTVILYALLDNTLNIIKNNQNLKKLFQNEWIHLFCIDPVLAHKFQLARNLTWVRVQ